MLFKILQQIDRTRFSPTVISLIGMGEFGSRLQTLNIPVYTLGMRRGWFNPLAIFRIISLLRKIQPDVIHTWMYHADLLGGVAARLAGFNGVIWCIRHSNLSKRENKRTTLWVVKFCAVLSQWVPAQIISCSHRAKHVHAAIGYSEKKLKVIPNGFDLHRFVPDVTARVSVRNELNLPADTLLVGLIARLDSQKNHLGFIQAAAQVHKYIPSAHFVLAGKGIDRHNSALMAAIADNDLQQHAHLLGRRDDVPRLMASLDVLASSSHGEAFPNVLGEAMASGVCCVVTDVGDSAEIVGDTGHVVPPGDMRELAQGLIQFLQLPSRERISRGTRARARVESNYEIQHVTRLYENCYQQIAENKIQEIS